ncbi:MAG: hypothetical protein GY835_26150 [bacterium]|nr:hypothetical protein [bacterium]
MKAAPKKYSNVWHKWAIPGEIFQIIGAKFLFRPSVLTKGFWLYKDENEKKKIKVGKTHLVIIGAIFSCERIIPGRGEAVKAPQLTYRGDDLEVVRGRLLQHCDTDGNFVLDIGFPIVLTQLEKCPELSHTRIGDIIEIELIPPTQASFL